MATFRRTTLQLPFNFIVSQKASRPTRSFIRKSQSAAHLIMKVSYVFVLLAACLLISRCDAQGKNSKGLKQLKNIIGGLSRRNTASVAAAITREFRRAGRCAPNVCFAIDGSRSIGKKNFDLQLKLVRVISAIIGIKGGALFSGVQYGLANKPISVKPVKAAAFLRNIKRTKWQKASRTFIGGGVAWCVQGLQRSRKSNKLVLLGEGRNTFGILGGLLGPAAIAKDFRSRSRKNGVFAVVVGGRNRKVFTDIVGGDRSLVLKVTNARSAVAGLLPLVKFLCA